MLIPRYSHLVTFKILEFSLKGNVLTGRGTVSPIYREMRETIKTINSILRELRIDPKSSSSFVNGDSDYYETLMEGEVVEG